MKRVYLRLWIALVTIVLGGLAVQEVVLYSESFSDDAATYYEQYAVAGIRGTLATEAGGRRATLEQVRALWPAPVRTVGAPPAEGPETYAMSPQVRWTQDGRGEFLYIDHPSLGWVQVGPLLPYPGPNWGNRAVLAGWVLLGIGLATWALLRPLDSAQRAIATTATAIAQGDLSARVPTDVAGGAREEVRAMNQMAERIEALVAARQSLLRAASHELRTPIARLRIGIHLLAQTEEGRDAREAALDDDLAELDALVEELLFHGRLQDPGVPVARSVVVLDGVVSAAGQALPGAPVIAAHLEVAKVWADPKLLQRALRNLLDNGVRYAAQTVEVRAYRQGEGVVVEVGDDGPGIDASQREQALAAFGMLDERSQTGLGLAIVHEIVARHGGTVELGDSALGGACGSNLVAR